MTIEHILYCIRLAVRESFEPGHPCTPAHIVSDVCLSERKRRGYEIDADHYFCCISRQSSLGASQAMDEVLRYMPFGINSIISNWVWGVRVTEGTGGT